jgi:hypothetical protein
MKKNFFKTMGKTLVIALLGIGLVTFSGCTKDQPSDPTPVTPTPDPDPNPNPNPNPDPNPGGSTSGDSWANLINETPHEAIVNGNTLTYGDHTYTVSGEITYDQTYYDTPTAFVTFTNIPSGVTEFKAVYDNLLGLSPQGAAAMVPMAIEIYARDANVGEQCFNVLCNSSSTVAGIVRILKTKFNYSQYSPENDPYVQRYLPAALLKGASYTNGYKPEEPYTVKMSGNPNGIQDAPLTGGTVHYTYILTDGGWDSFQRGVEIFQPYGSNKYQVFNCPSTYTQCRNIQNGPWAGLK